MALTTPVADGTKVATDTATIPGEHVQLMRGADDAGASVALATEAGQEALVAAVGAANVTAAPFAITPHATNALEREIKGIAIVTGGTIVYRHPDETEDRTITLPAGLFPLPATHIRDTSTASGLTGF